MNILRISSLKRMLMIFWSGFIFLNIGSCQEQPDTTGKIDDLIQFCAERKGFNLLGKFDVEWSNYGFTEKEFSLIHDLGFNFVRLPLDYRTYTWAGDWDYFVKQEVEEIDHAVEWGIKYNVHVCINLHRAPGFCVNPGTLPKNQQLDLWTDTVAQNAFVNHWKYFANRYKDIPAKNLSFNLVNEPANVTEELYVPVMKRAIDTIHAISPDRVIFIDGLQYGRQLVTAFNDEPNIAHAMHCYDPFGLTHYKAEWAEGSDSWPVPKWPMLWVSTYLYGPWKTEYKSPLVINGNFPQGTEVIVNVRQVSSESTLQIKADTRIILSKKFVCTSELGTDFTQIVNTQWGYQNISNKDFSGTITVSSTKLTFENTSGDWMTINSITLKNGDEVSVFNLSDDTWGEKQSTYTLHEDGTLTAADGSKLLPFEAYLNNIETAKRDSMPLMVQEFGVYNKTPHDVTIAFLTDLVKLFNDNHIGFALWNFSGSFGILNSDRSDCTYEAYNGFQLDREMLEALTQAGSTQGITYKDTRQLAPFPCPASDYIYITSTSNQGENIIQVRDISGRLRKNITVEGTGSEFIQMDVSDLVPGMYLISVFNDGSLQSGKIMIQ